MSLALQCPICKKLTSEESSQLIAGKTWVYKYKCGHKILKKHVASSVHTVNSKDNGQPTKPIHPLDDVKSHSGKTPRQYQIKGFDFWCKNNFRGVLADEMGLGKTPQTIFPLIKFEKELLPALIVVRSSAKLNWFMEVTDWSDILPQIMNKGKDKPNPLFKCFIISYSLLEKNPDMFKNIKLKTIIVDECHAVKNSDTGQSKVIKKLSEIAPYFMGLSGTPVLNNAEEYFPILNMVDPGKFPTKANFSNRWLDSYFDSYSGRYRVGGIRYPEEFREFTKDIILRRTRKEVLTELPELTRCFSYSDLSAEVEEAYEEAYKSFTEAYEEDNKKPNYFSNILGYMNIMRQLTGISKVASTLDLVGQFIETTDRKLVVFCHHKQVIEMLNTGLTKLMGELQLAKPLLFVSELNSNQRFDLIEKFRLPENRIMIASTACAGESINLQFCDESILAEREWNPGREDQAISGRFIRIGQTSDKVTATTTVAVGTIDEFFAALVEQKRSNFNITMGDDNNSKWDESQIQRELADILYQKGKSKWKLKKF